MSFVFCDTFKEHYIILFYMNIPSEILKFNVIEMKY